MAAAKQIVKVTLTLTKSTKGTHVFGNDALGLNLYFPKLLFGTDGTAPAEISLTLENVK